MVSDARGSGIRPPAVATGPLAEQADEFRRFLVDQGYARGTIGALMSLTAHISQWLDDQGSAVDALGSAAEVEHFFAERRAQGYRARLSPRALAPLLGFLRDRHVIQAAAAPAAAPTEVVLEEYRDYLRHERGAAASTVVNFAKYAATFLDALPGQGLVETLGALTAADVVRFVAGWASTRSSASGQAMVYALRSFLRFLHAAGYLPRPLAQAVPTVPGWKRARPPHGVTSQEMTALLAACDRGSATGLRDYAIMLLLTRLGLRAAEIAGISLGDIDWQQGVLTVRGKGNSVAELPLPADVGEAMAGYVRHGRVPCRSPRLFLRARAPFTGLGPTGIADVVRRACDRAGLPGFGPHRLRHAVACHLLRDGASLTEIGQLLRHRDERATARYAAVDVDALAELAMPCPQGAAL
jgi:integrase/recombinase XerD